MKRWYAVHTQARKEDKAELNLRRQGFEVYCPRLHKQRRHARKVETVRVPFFPSYIFARLDLDAERWRSINGSFGVRSLLAFGDRPSPAPESFVEALMEREARQGILAPPVPAFRPGEALVLEEGPFKDLVGRFERLADNERVMLLLDLMGRDVRVTAPLRAIRRAS